MDDKLRNNLYIICEAVIGLLAGAGNFIILSALVRGSKLHSVVNVLVANFALVNGLAGLMGGSITIFVFYGNPREFYSCIFANCVVIILVYASRIMLLTMAIERLLATKFTFWYATIPEQWAKLVCFIVWILAFAFGTGPLHTWAIPDFEISKCRFSTVISLEFLTFVDALGLAISSIIIILLYAYILAIDCIKYEKPKPNGTSLKSIAGHTEGSHHGSLTLRVYNKRTIVTFALIMLHMLLQGPLVVNTLFTYNQQFRLSLGTIMCFVLMDHLTFLVDAFFYAGCGEGVTDAVKEHFGFEVEKLNESKERPPGYQWPKTPEGISTPFQSSVHETPSMGTPQSLSEREGEVRESAPHAPPENKPTSLLRKLRIFAFIIGLFVKPKNSKIKGGSRKDDSGKVTEADDTFRSTAVSRGASDSTMSFQSESFQSNQ